MAVVHRGIFLGGSLSASLRQKAVPLQLQNITEWMLYSFPILQKQILHKDMNVNLLLKTQKMRRDCTIPSWPQWSEAQLLLVTGAFHQMMGLILVTCLQHLGLWSLWLRIWPVSFYSWGHKNNQVGKWWWQDENCDVLNSGLTFVFLVHISISQTGVWGLYLANIWEIPCYTQLPM